MAADLVSTTTNGPADITNPILLLSAYFISFHPVFPLEQIQTRKIQENGILE